MKLLKPAAKVLSVITGAVIIGLLVYAQLKLPQRSGELSMPGMVQGATVSFDQWGIPHIYADDDLDAFRALGYVHAQDRLFQMDLFRRLGSGRLSEMFGEAALTMDKTARVFGMTKFAREQLAYTQQHRPDISEKIDAYYQGVNHFIVSGPQPVEYDLLGMAPEPFTHQDVYAVMSYIAYSFASGARTDLLMQSLKDAVQPELYAQLVSGMPNMQASANAEQYYQQLEGNNIGINMSRVDQVFEQIQQFGHFDGSNAWVVSGAKTESGKPLFANDPHMPMSTPAIWYEAQVHTPSLNLYGHFLAGIPFPLLNRTEHHVYGLTMLLNDSVDFYVLPESAKASVQSRQESIVVKDGEDINLEVESSVVGPIVNDLFELAPTPKVAMGWSYTYKDNHLASMLYDVAFADGHEQMRTAIDQHYSPGINVLYADIDGNIAQWAAARYRQHPDNQRGDALIVLGEDLSEANTFYPTDYNPHRFNPPSEILFSVNHPLLLNNGEFAAGYYPPVSRIDRMAQLIDQKDAYSLADMQAWQTDNLSHQSMLLRDNMLAYWPEGLVLPEGTSASELKQTLAEWQGRYDAHEIAPSVIERFSFLLSQAIFADQMGEELFISFAKNGSLRDKSLHNVILDESSLWWDNTQTNSPESAQQIYAEVWQQTLQSLTDEAGGYIQDWQWQNMAQVLHPHPLGRVKPLDKLFNVGPFPLNSGARTLNNMLYRNMGERIVNSYGPSTRRVVDLDAIQQGLNINPVGQSGVVFDEHYDDQAELYLRGQYRNAEIWTKSQIMSAPERLVLVNE